MTPTRPSASGEVTADRALSGLPVADRVAARIGAAPDVDAATGEVIDVQPADGAQTPENGDGSTLPGIDAQTRHDAQRERAATAENVTPLRPEPASKKQLAEIAKAYKSSGMYEAEFCSVIETYGDFGADGYGLTEETAGFVLEALAERSS